MDIFDTEKRSKIMASVKSEDTRPELFVRRFLWSNGIRYRVHPPFLPGKPDIAIFRIKLAVFVNGCFWHGHEGCPRARLPKTRVEYWEDKIRANKTRDIGIEKKLHELGFYIRTNDSALKYLPSLLNTIRSI